MTPFITIGSGPTLWSLASPRRVMKFQPLGCCDCVSAQRSGQDVGEQGRPPGRGVAGIMKLPIWGASNNANVW